MRVKDGDKVRIRSDLVVTYDGKYGDPVSEEMLEFRGKIAVVVFAGLSGTRFLIDLDNANHVWHLSMIETLPYSELKSFLKGVSDEI